jgi:hypothetical protein
LSVSLPFVTTVVSSSERWRWIISLEAMLIAMLSSLDAMMHSGEMWRHFRSYHLALLKHIRLYELARKRIEVKTGMEEEVKRLEQQFIQTAEDLLTEESAKFFDQRKNELGPVNASRTSST